MTNILNQFNMGFIREPEGVDFVIQSKPLTAKQEQERSAFIAKRKQEIQDMKKKSKAYARTKQTTQQPVNP